MVIFLRMKYTNNFTTASVTNDIISDGLLTIRGFCRNLRAKKPLDGKRYWDDTISSWLGSFRTFGLGGRYHGILPNIRHPTGLFNFSFSIRL